MHIIEKQSTDFGPRPSGESAKPQTRWPYPSDWLSERYPAEAQFVSDYQIAEDEIQDRHQNEMDRDGFFGSDTICDDCDKPLQPGTDIWTYIYKDLPEQTPLHHTCARRLHKEELTRLPDGDRLYAIIQRLNQLHRLKVDDLITWVLAYEVDALTLAGMERNVQFKQIVVQGDPPDSVYL